MDLRSGEEDDAKGHLTEAENSFQTVLDIDPSNESALNGMGSVFTLRGDLERAETYVRKALGIAPSYQAAQNDLRLIQELKRRR